MDFIYLKIEIQDSTYTNRRKIRGWKPFYIIWILLMIILLINNNNDNDYLRFQLSNLQVQLVQVFVHKGDEWLVTGSIKYESLFCSHFKWLYFLWCSKENVFLPFLLRWACQVRDPAKCRMHLFLLYEESIQRLWILKGII